MRPKIHLIELKNRPIFEQLQLEEALLRTSDENFCIINYGSTPAIVMGISGAAEKLIHIPSAKEANIPIIKRFSGGGTVVVDENTLFITFIFSKNLLPITPFPEPILRWSAELYKECWKIPHFELVENDYCIKDLKCGGNAQYIRKDRWLHHTSFLFDYRAENMNFLKMPEKRPKYRKDRDHLTFLTPLKKYANSAQELIFQFKESLVKQLYIHEEPFKEEIVSHRKTAELLIL